MTSITIRIPDDLRKRMSEIKDVNWSEVARRAIVDRINVEEKSKGKNWDLIRKASDEADEFRRKLKAEQGASDFDSSETIRRWRDARVWREQS
jgi:predicted transcriptional regulator